MKPPSHMETRKTIGQKLVSPSSLRNGSPIAQKLLPLLAKNARVLEIASGTGQHGAYMCEQRSDINWQFTDIDQEARQSQNAYAQDFPRQMNPSLHVDVTADNWQSKLEAADVIYCANMVHIAPWEAALGLAKGAKKLLGGNGVLCIYGPFLLERNSAQSNLDFNASLKSRNPQWGVRTLESVKHIFADEGLYLHSAMDLPRDNYFLVFKPSIRASK